MRKKITRRSFLKKAAATAVLSGMSTILLTQQAPANISKNKNLIIPYDDMNGKFLINQVKVLNHKWIIANFSDGTLWGELLIKYSIDESGINFKTNEHFIYPK